MWANKAVTVCVVDFARVTLISGRSCSRSGRRWQREMQKAIPGCPTTTSCSALLTTRWPSCNESHSFLYLDHFWVFLVVFLTGVSVWGGQPLLVPPRPFLRRTEEDGGGRHPGSCALLWKRRPEGTRQPAGETATAAMLSYFIHKKITYKIIFFT